MAHYQNFYDFPHVDRKGKKHLRYSYGIMFRAREQPSARQARVYGLLARDFMHIIVYQQHSEQNRILFIGITIKSIGVA